ncbi:arabinosyltransferase domain-containing protein [Nocardia sp. R6R-6]|uniref:arabinosyltransferase domain-containing protein n=1 Tax=Nocardia sp. R6R-6 TaxID=3459303 RepID=UPI00403DD0CF
MADTVVYAGRPSDTRAEPEHRTSRPSQMRLIAVVSGLLGALLAIAVPFLPVRMAASSIVWPQAGVLNSVEAPLVSYAPVQLAAQIPCAALETLADTGGVVVSTVPRQSASMERYGFVVKVVPDTSDRPGRVDVVSRNRLLWSGSVESIRGHTCTLAIDVAAAGTTVSLVGGGSDPGTRVDSDVRPQVVGVFTDLTGNAPEGMRVDIAVDSRFSTSPTPLKLAAIALCLLMTMASLVALHRLDQTDGRTTRRFLPPRWWRLRPTDWVVFATLLVWHFIGANTSDDGYILGMARGSQSSGYMSNYYRWFSVDEGPFYTPYADLIAVLTHVSTASAWVRLPTLAAAVITWWVISREIIPRLGVAVCGDKVVAWTAAMTFLAFWLPYNNGLRAEPFVAMGAVLTWVSIERAIATRRLLPAAAAIVIAALTLTVAPSGLICVGALLAGARSLTTVVVRRARSVGYLPQLLPLLASGLVVLTVVFADRTLAAVLEMSHVHGLIGPGESWFFEFLRYQFLLQLNADGWLSRRFGMFMMVLGLVVCVVTMLRRGGHIPGTAVGPSHRVVGITVAAMVLMMFSPTKWTHQFGVFAGLAACVAALTAVAVSPRVMQPLRNRALFATALFFALALTFVGANGYWYVSAWGIPWWDKPPTLAGKGLSSFAAGFSFLALAAAAWFHIRPRTRLRADSIAGRVARIPVPAVAAAVMVLFLVASFVKASVAQYPSYSVAKSNLSTAFAGGCGLADDVLVETDPNVSMLRPLAGEIGTALAGSESTGFSPNGVAPVLTSDEVESTTGRANSVSDDQDKLRDAAKSAGSESDTSHGSGINGSNVALPFGLDPATTPVLGSFREGQQVPGSLTTDWYQLPDLVSGSRGDIIAIAVAGRIRSIDSDGVIHPGQNLELEYGTTQPDNNISRTGRILPIDIGPSPMWRNLRVPLDQLPADADVVRLVAHDKDLDKDQWLAVTPPRVPQTKTLNSVVGSTTPVLLDWAVGLHFPCQNPVPTRAGISVLPEYRILPDRNGATITNLWQGHDGGGPLGWTQLLFTARALPSYLDSDWDRDWGSIEQFIQVDPSARPAQVTIDDIQRPGTWTPGHIITSY